MGKGVAIEPSVGEVFAPANGKVEMLFPTNHAIGIVTENGAKLLIHVGMDTVELTKGKYFIAHISQGDQIHVGQKLISFDIEAIREKGYSVLTPIIVTNSESYSSIKLTTLKKIEVDDELMKVIK